MTVKIAVDRSMLKAASFLKSGFFKVFSITTLMLLLLVNVLPAGSASLEQTFDSNLPNVSAASTRSFISTADAYVDELHPTRNNGTSSILLVENAAKHDMQSYLRFTVTGISGTVQSAQLRVYMTTNNSNNGPAVYATGSTWTETGLTWNNRPQPTTGIINNKGAISKNTWIQYNVVSRVTGNGTYAFILIGDTSDQIGFSSREGSHPPQLVITTSTNTPTAGAASPTPPTNKTATPSATLLPGSVVLVGAGDISSCSNNNDEATAKLLDGISGTVFTAGDNAYDGGTYTQYINCYDPTWGRQKTRTHPVPGNHEYETSGAAGYFQYFNNVPAYYAYNLGTWRIYALNSEIDVTATGAEAKWLQSDLAANPKQCVLAYWHRPRWSSGSTHGSSADLQTLWQILYNAGAELVINGHEHNYERFTQMNVSGAAVATGLREIVVGTGGESHYGFGTILTTSQVRNSSTYGVLKLTLNASSYSWQFVPIAGSTFTDSGSSSCH